MYCVFVCPQNGRISDEALGLHVSAWC